VVYQALYGDFQVYVRPYHMFVSEVDHVKYPEVKQKYRFEKYDVNSGSIIKEKEGTVSNLNIQKEGGIIEYTNQIPDVHEVVEASVEEDITSNEEGQISQLLLEFLDCNTYEEKLDKFIIMKNKVNDRLLNDIAMSLDITVNSESLKEKYEEIKNCLLTFVHFEDNRMR
jgi:hypothetical protein